MDGIKITVSARDVASAVINAVGKSINRLAYEFKQADIRLGNIKNIANNLVDSGKNLILTGGAVLAGFALAVDKAAKMNEVQEKFNTVTGEAQGMAEDFSKTLQKSYSLSEMESKKFLSTISQFLLPMGLTRTESVKLANGFVKLSSDISEFNKVSIDEVLQATEKAITGSYKGLKQYGIVLDQTSVEQEVYRLNLAKSKDEITDAMKVYATFSLMQSKAGDAVGSTARNYNDFDKVLERFKKSMGGVQIAIGQQLIESTIRALNSTTTIINSVKEWANEHEGLTKIIVLSIASLASLTIGVGALNLGFGFLLKGIISIYKALIVLPIAVTKFLDVTAGIQTYINLVGAAETVSAKWALTMKIGVIGAVIFTTYQIYQLIKAIKEANNAWDETAESIDALSEQEHKLHLRAIQAAKDTGLRIKNWEDLVRLQKEGIVMWDREAQVFKKVEDGLRGHNKELDFASDKLKISGEDLKKFKETAMQAYKTAKDKAKEYADKLIEMDSVIAGHKDKLQQMLRESQREGMTNLQAYQDKQREMEERNSKAKELMQKASNESDKKVKDELFKQAQDQLDASLSIVQGLGDAIKETNSEGTEVVIQSAAMSRKFKESAIQSLTELQNQMDQKIKGSLQENEKSYESQSEKLKKLVDSFPKEITTSVITEINEDSYYKVVELIKKITGEKTLNLDIKISKGTIPGFNKEGTVPGLSTGALLPGYGGGDRIHILGEPGEFMVRKEAVRKFGANFFATLNSLKMPSFGSIASNLVSSIPLPRFNSGQLAFATGGIIPNLQLKDYGKIDLAIGGKTYPVMGEINVIDTLKTVLTREKLKRPNVG